MMIAQMVDVHHLLFRSKGKYISNLITSPSFPTRKLDLNYIAAW
jgi:hypothetical protein